MDTLANPHDACFRKSFGRREIAQDFLRQQLPEELLWLHYSVQGTRQVAEEDARRLLQQTVSPLAIAATLGQGPELARTGGLMCLHFFGMITEVFL
jgi:hypothetical protein